MGTAVGRMAAAVVWSRDRGDASCQKLRPSAPPMGTLFSALLSDQENDRGLTLCLGNSKVSWRKPPGYFQITVRRKAKSG